MTEGSPVTTQDEPQENLPVQVGDRVEIILPGSRYQEQTGTVRRLYQDRGLTVYTVQPDGVCKRIDYRRSDLRIRL